MRFSPSTLHPSFPNAFKSKLYLELEGWNAQIKVDHDQRNRFSLRRILKARATIEELAGRVRDVTVHKTAKGHHVRIYLASRLVVRARTVLLIQSMLGDDPMRQKFNAARVRRGEMGWNVLWTTKIRNGHPVMIERLDEERTAKARKILVRP